MPEFRVKRIYEEPSVDDGVRLLVDRLWPRGISKEAAKINLWAKELTPSHELRKWFHDHSDQLTEFADRYRRQLREQTNEITLLMTELISSKVTLVTATKDLDRGHVAVLKAFLEDLFA